MNHPVLNIKEEANKKGWKFAYGTDEFNNVLSTDIVYKSLFLFPIQRSRIFGNFGQFVDWEYSTSIMLAEKSNIDELYYNKYFKRIEGLFNELDIFLNNLTCKYNYNITSYNAQEVINQYDNNFDAVRADITFSIY
jgi:hypothetical protein